MVADPRCPTKEQAETLYRAGISAAANGDHATAIDAFAQAARLAPLQADYHVNHGVALFSVAAETKDGELARAAISAFAKAQFLNPRLHDVYGYIGAAHCIRQESDEGVRYLSLAPDSFFEAHPAWRDYRPRPMGK